MRGLISDLTNLVRDNLALGLTVALPHDRYMNEYRAPPIPSKMHFWIVSTVPASEPVSLI